MKRWKWFLKAIRIAGVVGAWSAKALEDDIVTLPEAVTLAVDICEVLGVQPELDLSQR